MITKNEFLGLQPGHVVIGHDGRKLRVLLMDGSTIQDRRATFEDTQTGEILLASMDENGAIYDPDMMVEIPGLQGKKAIVSGKAMSLIT